MYKLDVAAVIVLVVLIACMFWLILSDSKRHVYNNGVVYQLDSKQAVEVL